MDQNQKQFVIQKVPGYPDSFMIVGGPEPRIVKRRQVQNSVRVLRSQIGLQQMILQKMDELDTQEVAKEPQTVIPQVVQQ